MIPLLHLRSSGSLYGADRALVGLAAATGEPYAPLVATLVRPGAPDAVGEAARAAGVESLRLDSAARADLGSAARLTAILRARGVGLVHAHDYKSLLVAQLACARARVPVVATYHGDTGATWQLAIYERLARVCGNFTRGVAAVSGALELELRRWVRRAPVVRVANGIPLPAPFAPGEREQARAALGLGADFAVAVVGRMSREKGQEILLEALAQLERPPLVLFAGDGPDRPALEARAAGLPVRFLGFVADPRALYAACDAVVMPSLTEGLPLAALEAMAHGRPLVASAVGELPLLLAGGAGILVPPGDPAALAAAIVQLQRDPAASVATAARAARRVRESYSVEAMARGYAALLYAPALSSATRPRSRARGLRA